MKEETKEQSKELATIEKGLAEPKSFESLGTFDDIVKLAEKLVSMESKLVPFKKAGDVVIVLQAARDFRMPITFALANIHPIGGKASAGVHLLSAQLLKNFITYEVVEDYVEEWQYLGQGSIPISQDEFIKNPDKYHLIGKKTEEENYHPSKLNCIKHKVIDRRTVIKFERQMPQPDGSYKLMTIYGKFSDSEADKANLFNDKPDTWGKYPRAMVYARAFADGSKKIGNDVLLGMKEVSTMCDVFNVPYHTDQNGNATPDLKAAGIIRADDEAVDVDVEIVD